MSDNVWFYLPLQGSSGSSTGTSGDLTDYTLLTRHIADSNVLGAAIATNYASYVTFVTAQSNIDTVQDDRIAACEERFTDEDSFKWHDLIGPVITGGSEFGSEFLKYWLDKTNVKDKLVDLIDDFLGKNIPGLDSNGDSNVDAPRVQADWRFLANNDFATDRSVTGMTGYGTAFMSDMSFGGNARICTVPATEVISHADYGVAWATSMNSTKKQAVFTFSNLTASLSNVNCFNMMTASNATILSNCTASNLAASNSVLKSATASNVTASNVIATNATIGTGKFTTWNVTPASVAVASCDVSGNIAAQSVNINGNACKILSSGELQINNNTFRVATNGDVTVNGVKVIEGTSGQCVVYDDQVRPRSLRMRLVDILAGNIGSSDVAALGDPTLSLPPAVANTPLFSSGANESLYRWGSSAWAIW